MSENKIHPTYEAENCTDVDQLFEYALKGSVVTREGAVYGLTAQAERIIGLLQRLRDKDESLVIQEIADNALVDISGAFDEDKSPDGAIIDGMER